MKTDHYYDRFFIAYKTVYLYELKYKTNGTNQNVSNL